MGQAGLPNLFIVGAPKCGTTAWAEYLGAHPDIFFPKYKDQCFFALDLPNFRLTRTEADYAALFADSGDAKVIGEASAMYLSSEAAADAIRVHDLAAKILIFLREQEDYLPSLHNQFLREFAEEIEDFQTAWRLSEDRPPDTIPPTCLEPRTLNYAAMGRFKEQVERYLAAFPREQIRVIQFAEWTADPRGTYLGILEFLGLDDDGRVSFPPVNPGMTYRWRSVARLIARPPAVVRGVARLMRRLAVGEMLYRRVKAIGFLSAPGYRGDISEELRQDIRGYYEADNRKLDEILSSDANRLASTQPKR